MGKRFRKAVADYVDSGMDLKSWPRLERLNLRRLIEIEIEIENSNLQMEMRLTPEMSIISELGLATLHTGSSSELPPHEQAQGHLPKIEVPQNPI